MKYFRQMAIGVLALSMYGQAQADINVGVVLSLTGPYASIGIPERDTVLLWPKEIEGQKLNVTILDDASDPTTATLVARKFVTENKVDFIAGPSGTPSALAVLQVASETRTPMVAMAGGGAIVAPMDAARKWAFKTPPTEEVQLQRVFDKMKKSGQKRLGIVAINSAYGQTFVDVMQKIVPNSGIEIAGIERFGGTDTSFVSQALKMLASKPDAILIVAPGTPAAMPQLALKRRGFAGTFFQTQAAANNDYLRVGGKDVEGTLMSVSPMLVAEQLPESNPTKKVSVAIVNRYEKIHGPNTRSLSVGVAWSALLLLENAVPNALKAAKPGTPEFRTALRDALEKSTDLVTPEGVYTMSPENHNGADERSQVLVKVENGKWRYVD
ncbi:ABC transporter substrate-binding protein [Eoetvoesiella caeni]